MSLADVGRIGYFILRARLLVQTERIFVGLLASG
jgi:hypothetical protein